MRRQAIRRQLRRIPRAERETDVDNTIESLERVLRQFEASREELKHSDIEMEIERKLHTGCCRRFN